MTPTPLARAKVYRNIELRQELVGLEPLDAVSLGVAAWILMIVNRAVLWNLLALAILYVAVRIAKRGKPEGFTTTLLRYHLRHPFFSAAAPDEKLAIWPFPIVTDRSVHMSVDPNPRRVP